NPLGLPRDVFGVDARRLEELRAELRRRAMDDLRVRLTVTKPPAGLPDVRTQPTGGASARAIERVTAALTDQRAEVDRNADAIRDMREISLSFAQDFRSALADGKSWWDALGE